jgi:hypothetical protein
VATQAAAVADEVIHGVLARIDAAHTAQASRFLAELISALASPPEGEAP